MLLEEQVAVVQEAVRQQAAAVVELGSGISSVAADQEKLLQDVSESMVTVTQLHQVAQNVEQGMRDSQAAHQELLESERHVAQKLTALELLHSEHAEAVRKTWQVLFLSGTFTMQTHSRELLWCPVWL